MNHSCYHLFSAFQLSVTNMNLDKAAIITNKLMANNNAETNLEMGRPEITAWRYSTPVTSALGRRELGGVRFRVWHMSYDVNLVSSESAMFLN